MKKLTFWSLSLVILMQLSYGSAFGAVSFGPDTKTDIKDVKLSESVKIDDASPALPRIAQGLRQKKVVLAWFSVYVAQIFSGSAKPVFTSIADLKASLIKGLPVVISMTFVRSVDIGKIVDGFEEEFKENKMDATKAPYSDFLAAIKKSGDVKDKQKFFFVFSGTDDKRSLSIETDGKQIFSLKDQDSNSVNSFMDIWLGKPADSGLEKLQDQLLKPTASK